MNKEVDSFRFTSRFTERIVKSWVKREQVTEIPWTPLAKPLEQSTLAFISTAGIAMHGDQPFDQEGERQDPWWGDPTFRQIPQTASADDIEIYHLHVDPRYAKEDLNCLLPLQRAQELVVKAEIGRLAPTHYSIMGYILRPRVLLEETTPAIIAQLQQEGVDVVVLVPV